MINTAIEWIQEGTQHLFSFHNSSFSAYQIITRWNFAECHRLIMSFWLADSLKLFWFCWFMRSEYTIWLLTQVFKLIQTAINKPSLPEMIYRLILNPCIDLSPLCVKVSLWEEPGGINMSRWQAWSCLIFVLISEKSCVDLTHLTPLGSFLGSVLWLFLQVAAFLWLVFHPWYLRELVLECPMVPILWMLMILI